MFEHLRRAADRGVRVRLLLDDNSTTGLDAVLAALGAHPNIEVRLFNPFRNRRWRLWGYLTDFSRLNRRVHNKSFTVDNQVTIIGGRNVGNEYFEAGHDLSFSDLDLLAIGSVVDSVSSNLERYWTSGSSCRGPLSRRTLARRLWCYNTFRTALHLTSEWRAQIQSRGRRVDERTQRRASHTSAGMIDAADSTLATTTASAQTAPKLKMTTDIPKSITTPDSVETRPLANQYRRSGPVAKCASVCHFVGHAWPRGPAEGDTGRSPRTDRAASC